ncbi:glycosyltransferase [Ideonella sp. 4Y16]|uniref:glycosyltransferase family 2 protein n=1 Tax=Ideonella alba TaxID=2824118 RepID=UPI001B39B87E|nr:glycosyltransferase family 2 protein [Ideonella alba]MBQ0943126.1 glycosyltransferase [Ideonella alba]
MESIPEVRKMAASGNTQHESKVCYIIPVYNNKAGLLRTLGAIANSRTKPNKILIVDDGSKEPIDLAGTEFSEICHVFRHDVNKGISVGLNRLISEASALKFDFAALVDAGDLPTPDRLDRQLEFLRINPQVAVLGGSMRIIGLDGKVQTEFAAPITARDIHIAFRRGYPFAHPTATFRLALFTSFNISYNPNIRASVDYDMLYRLHLANPESVRNIPDILVEYVREAESIGIRRATLQAREAYRIRLRHASLSSLHSLVGLMDIRLLTRAFSAKLFFAASDFYRSLKRRRTALQ